ncbi:MAG: hypothetical protein ACFCVA_03660, partial [Gammaproteobacteria bacterium]
VYLATPRRGGRKLNLHTLPFKTLLTWLTHWAEETFGFDDTSDSTTQWSLRGYLDDEVNWNY